MKELKSWIPVDPQSDFTIHNLPFGIFSTVQRTPRVGVAIGNQILDLAAVARKGLLDKWRKTPWQGQRSYNRVFTSDTLNGFIGLGKETTSGIRLQIQKWLSSPRSILKKYPELFVTQRSATMYMPVKIGDYTDFYSSIEHASNVGKMFRDPANALLPNWLHMPVGYHGRASSIVLSGQNVHRPMGQVLPKGKKEPVYKASGRMDFELEMAAVIGGTTQVGDRVSTADATNYIFGMVLFNDWSARDIQKWEYVPLGPFLGKSFASSISPWIVTMDALEPFRVSGPRQDPKVLPYLKSKGKQNYNINLSVGLTPNEGTETIICESNFRYMYWNMSQQLAHHTVNGCNLNVGDMMASGTISGKKESSYGSMLELSWGGTKTIDLDDGSTRTFIEDYDTITMRGFAKKGNIRVGFGEVKSQLLPAKD